MSKYSGKCDFYDVINIHGLDYILRSKIYIGNSDNQLDLKEKKDLIPYYSYTVAIAGYDKDSCFIRLSSHSYVDEYEKESLEFYLNEFKKIYKHCKRNGEKFEVKEDWLNKCMKRDEIQLLADRVSELGEDATTKGIHFDSLNILYREPLVKEMIKNGYSEDYAKQWVYGKDDK